MRTLQCTCTCTMYNVGYVGSKASQGGSTLQQDHPQSTTSNRGTCIVRTYILCTCTHVHKHTCIYIHVRICMHGSLVGKNTAVHFHLGLSLCCVVLLKVSKFRVSCIYM